MKRTILTVIATVVATLSLMALGALVVAPALNRDTAMDSEPAADYVEGYESDGTTRDPDYWQQEQLEEQRRLRQQQQQQWQQQQWQQQSQQSQQSQYQQQQDSRRQLEQSRQRMQETQSQMCRNWGGGGAYC